MTIQDLPERKVSFQTTAWSSLSKEMTIQEVLHEIKSNKYFSQISKLRTFIRNGEMKNYNIHKKRLPAVTFCGTFAAKRKKEYLKEYNQLLIIDIDKLSDDELERIKRVLNEDRYVFAFWESPSQNGIKGLVSLTYQIDFKNQTIDSCHKSAFIKLRKYFFNTYNIILDESGSDTTRLCFFSYDKNLTQKTTFDSFVINELELEQKTTPKEQSTKKSIKIVGKRDALYNPKGRNSPYHRIRIQAIIKFLKKRRLSITYSYENWYRVAFIIANTFTHEIGEKYFLSLSKMDADKFDEINCKNMLIYSYENRRDEISFKSIEFLAKQKGYLAKKQKEVVPKTAHESLS